LICDGNHRNQWPLVIDLPDEGSEALDPLSAEIYAVLVPQDLLGRMNLREDEKIHA
jgi:hypothetical protein